MKKIGLVLGFGLSFISQVCFASGGEGGSIGRQVEKIERELSNTDPSSPSYQILQNELQQTSSGSDDNSSLLSN